MTPEESQRTIEGMLQVQRELQESQIRLQQELQPLAELSQSNERKLERLSGP